MLLNNDDGVFITAIFTGHIYDTVIDVYFAQARFYDAKNRQWLSSNPMKDGLNWYQYVGANPVTYTDPWGLEPVGPILPSIPEEFWPDFVREQRDPNKKPIQQELLDWISDVTGLSDDAMVIVGALTAVALAEPTSAGEISLAATLLLIALLNEAINAPTNISIPYGYHERFYESTTRSDTDETEKTRDAAPVIPKMEHEPRATHHIVAKADHRAEDSRRILRNNDISINSPHNLIRVYPIIRLNGHNNQIIMAARKTNV